jgi:hypothetical protein
MTGQVMRTPGAEFGEDRVKAAGAIGEAVQAAVDGARFVGAAGRCRQVVKAMIDENQHIDIAPPLVVRR